MRFATAQLAALAYYILSTEATFPLLGDIFNCIPHTPPVCTDLGLYHDSSISLVVPRTREKLKLSIKMVQLKRELLEALV